MFLRKKLKAFGGIEIILAGSIMTLTMVSLLGLLFYSQDSIKRENLSSKASSVANEGMEAVSSIRDRAFSELTEGLHGLSFIDGQWEFLGQSDDTGNFSRTVTVSTVSENIKKVAVAVNWLRGPGRISGISLYKYFSNWQGTESFNCDRWFADGEYFSYHQTACDKGDLVLAEANVLYEGLISNGNSLEFSASSDYIQTNLTAADLNIDGNKPRTVELWAKTYSFTDKESLFAFGAPASAGRDFSLRTLNSDNRWRLQLWGAYDIDFDYTSLNKWVHFAIVHDGARTNVYADGILMNGRDNTLDTVADQNLDIARWSHWSLPSTFNGRIREFRIWDRALDQSEILSNMSKQMVGNESNLTAYWPLDEGVGTQTMEKVSGIEYSFVGSPVWTKDIPDSSEFLPEGNRVSKVYNLDEYKNIVSSNISWVKDVQDFKTALSFNGSPNYVLVNNSDKLNPANISIATWVKWNIDPSTGASWSTIVNKDGDNHYRLQHNSSNTAFEFGIRTENGGRHVSGTTAPQEGVWYFLVGTYDGSSLKIYVDGVLERSTNINGNLVTSIADLNIGRRAPGNRYFNGEIDELSIFDRALSSEEIEVMMNQEVKNPVADNSLMAYYKFNEESGATALDSSGNSNNGLIIFSTPEPYRVESQFFSKIDIHTAISNSNTVEPTTYDLAENNSPIIGVNPGDNLSGKYLWIKQSLETYNIYNTPRLKSLSFNIESDELILSQADQLSIDTSSAEVNPSDRNQVRQAYLSNIGPDNIINIKKIRPIWSGVLANRELESITIGGVSVWSGSEPSGSILDLNTPYDLALGDSPEIIFNFNRNVRNIVLYANFTMTDDSQKQGGILADSGVDLISPSAINDLGSTGIAERSITLSWTAPGDDGDDGLASSYEIRYSQNNITDANWESASIFSGAPMPEMAGTLQSVEVGNLAVNTGYYFAIKTTDDSGNTSDISNIVYDVTTGLNQAERLLIDSSGGQASGFNVIGINLSNLGPSQSISIKKIKPSWSGISSIYRLASISIGGSNVWSGWASSGTELELNNPLDLNFLSGEYPLIFRFSGVVNNINLYAGFIMADDSQKQQNMIAGEGVDSTPPATISDLRLGAKDHESVTLSWTAPGDDGNTGLASYYEIRYSQSEITDSNWSSADIFLEPPLPEMAGNNQSVIINNLSFSTGYYFAIKTTDDNGNISALSNIFHTTTNELPQSTYLQVDISGAEIGPNPLNDRNVSGIIIDNNSSSNISIKSISGTWTSRRVREIFINGSSIWTGSSSSGGVINLSTPYTLIPGEGPYNLRLRFNNRFSGQTINYLDFTLSDDSVKRSDSKSF